MNLDYLSGSGVDLSRQTERVAVNHADQQDEPAQELWSRDVSEILKFARHELDHPGKAPKSAVELFLKLFLQRPHIDKEYS